MGDSGNLENHSDASASDGQQSIYDGRSGRRDTVNGTIPGSGRVDSSPIQKKARSGCEVGSGDVDYSSGSTGGLHIPRKFKDVSKCRGTRDHYEFWCRAHAQYIDVLYSVAVDRLKNLKGPGGHEPSVREFYSFAYTNSSGFISPYV